METTNPATAVNTCACGSPIHYEPILVSGRDLARPLHRVCDPCKALATAAAEKSARAARAARQEALVVEQLPPDLLDTQTNHPTFNTGLWAAVDLWSPTHAEYWLGIIGGAGRCKTRCMALMAARLIRAGHRLTWTTSNRLRDAAMDRHNRNLSISTIARAHLAACLTTPWLFLDDFGKNEWSPAFESQLFQILDHRKNHRLPLVYSSNAHPSDFSLTISSLNAAPIIGRLLDRTTILELA